ncbi:MFS transporter [Komagataeibacter sp. FNDCF1]|uniref:MFS transporter n=1 Tax=Komagataeibacter sp. FNDCF1 TaxID=2878681 RepID=UPI001E4A971F|nr:MFS transporter [Komagataeibacter sp. FNDCF1]MCE2563325.1 MFS transporter [Komagataeibacter sp. FNDCF1]
MIPDPKYPPDASETRMRLDAMPLRRFHLLTLVATSGGQFCDGYVLGTIGAALPGVERAMHCNDIWMGAIGSASLAGLFFGCLLIGPLTDRLGRRRLLRLNMPLFIILSLVQALVTSPLQLVLARILLGACLAADYVAGSAYLSEFAPLRLRGRFLASMIVGWSAGYCMANIFGMLFTMHGSGGWRLCLFSSAIPAALVMMLRIFLPESPRWLMARNRPKEAQQVLKACFPNDRVFVAPAVAKQEENWRTVFTPPWRRRLAVGAGFYVAQVVPYFCIGTFLPELFTALGVRDVYTGGVVFNLFLLIGSIAALWLVDRLTRRTFLIGSFLLAAAFLVGVSFAAQLPLLLTLVFFGLLALTLAAATSLEMVYLPELFPINLRGVGVGIATACSRLGSLIGTFLLPVLMRQIGTPLTLGICALILVGGAVLCAAWAPETRDSVL